MNEKIRELISQATERQTPHASDMGDWNVIQKFAELIVRKCARMADCEKNRDPGAFILEQFGVEE